MLHFLDLLLRYLWRLLVISLLVMALAALFSALIHSI